MIDWWCRKLESLSRLYHQLKMLKVQLVIFNVTNLPISTQKYYMCVKNYSKC